MTNRILDFSEKPVRLAVSNSLLVIRFPSQDGDLPPGTGDGTSGASMTAQECEKYRCEQMGNPNGETIPLTDVAVVVASHPQISFTQAVLSGLAAAGGILVTCDKKHMPASMLLPLSTHSLQAERFAAQAALPLPTKKRMWKQIVQAKIQAQADLLAQRTGRNHGLSELIPHVRSGDPENVEARAARIYWSAVFGAGGFRRDADADGLNACLNYGYAVLRAITARALCAAGLHPCLGVHHHNRYDSFCLADDLMEPFRPIVDREAAKLADAGGMNVALGRESKRALVGALVGRFSAHSESRTLFDWIGRSAASIVDVIEGRADRVELPALVSETPPS